MIALAQSTPISTFQIIGFVVCLAWLVALWIGLLRARD